MRTETMRPPAGLFASLARHGVAVALAACAGCAGPQVPVAPVATTGFVHVRLMHLERAVPGARVTAARNLGVALLEERVVVAAAADGLALLALAPGTWYLSATSEAPAIYGWYGSNPVQVRAGESIDATIPAVPGATAAAASATPGEETISGEVLGESGPVVGASVALYLDASTQFRGPGYLEIRTDGRGAFEAPLSPGSYWLVARRRSGPQVFGPLEPGDDYGFYPGNPLEIRAGERVAVRIPTVRVLKKSGWSGQSATRRRIAGTIRDAAGRPVPGFRAFLHAKAAMLGKPEFVSEPSGADGGFQIWVDREGIYYLGARAEIGRAREVGEALGLYTGSPDHAIEVRLDAGAMPPLEIVVGRAP